ncbi:hypothetical protein Dimus_035120 [Dionaea muscipula]
MAKGRRLTTSRRELYLGSYHEGLRHGQAAGALTEESELREEDVWSIVDRAENGSESESEWGTRADYGSSNGQVVGMMSGGSRRTRIPSRDTRHVGGLTLAFDEDKTASSRITGQSRGVQENGGHPPPRRHQIASSAPVNVPDWNRIHRVDSADSLYDPDCFGDAVGFDDHESAGWDPPHEYLARSRKSAATSVFKGVDRTLKGWDMSRLRDAVWSQTGFDG